MQKYNAKIISEHNLHSNLSKRSVFPEDIVHLLRRDFVRQIPDIQNAVDLRR